MTRPRRALAAFVLILSWQMTAQLLGAATLDARSLTYLPASYSPGEEVVVEAILAAEGAEKFAEMDLKAGAGLPKQDAASEVELRGLWLSRTATGWLIRLRFVPWSPGALMIPAQRIKGILIPAIPYSAITVLGPEDRDPSPPRRQRDLPGTALYLYGLLGILIAIALAALGTAFYLVPAARALLARRRAAQAFRRFVTSLDYLEAESGTADGTAFFSALLRACRLYLASRGLPEAPALTATEIAAVSDHAFPAPATKPRVAALFAKADRLRYGGPGPAADQKAARAMRETAVAEARAIGEATEEALRARP